MPLFTSNGRAVYFAHVPKTGGSSVKDYLVRRFGNLSILDREGGRRNPRTGLILPASHLAAADLEELLPQKLDYCFAVVRDPIERLQSEYRFQHGYSWASRLSFATWLRIVAACVKMDPRIYQNHIRPQNDLVPEGAEVFYLDQGGMEKIILKLDEITGESGEEMSIKHINKSKSKNDGTLYANDIEIMLKIYEADYKRFAFSKPDPAQYEKDNLVFFREMLAFLVAPVIVWRQRLRWLR